jgi:membrane protein
MSAIPRDLAHPRPAERAPTTAEDGQGAGERLMVSVRAAHERLLREQTAYGVLVDVARAYQKHQPGLLARQAAYALLYALPAILLVLVSLAVIVERNTGFAVSATLQEFIAGQSPGEVQPLLAALLQSAIAQTSEDAALLAALVSLGIAVWSAAGGVGALMYAVNAVYDVRDTRSLLRATVTRLGLMLLGGILVVGAFVLFIFGRRIADWLATGPVDLDPALTGLLTSGPVWSLGMLFASLLLLYGFALDLPKSLRWLLPGAVLAALAVAIVFALLDLILTVSNPGTAYGAAGSVLVLLWTIFIVSQFVVIGAILNAVLGRRYDGVLRAALAAHPEKRLDLCDPEQAADAQDPGTEIAVGSSSASAAGVPAPAGAGSAPPSRAAGVGLLALIGAVVTAVAGADLLRRERTAPAGGGETHG